MQNQSEREKLNMEYKELLKKEREAREAGNYDIIGTLHCQIHKKHEEIILFDDSEQDDSQYIGD